MRSSPTRWASELGSPIGLSAPTARWQSKQSNLVDGNIGLRALYNRYMQQFLGECLKLVSMLVWFATTATTLNVNVFSFCLTRGRSPAKSVGYKTNIGQFNGSKNTGVCGVVNANGLYHRL